MAAISTVKWKPIVRMYCANNYGDMYYIGFIYKGKIERRVNENIRMFRQVAWNDAFVAAIELNKIESAQV